MKGGTQKVQNYHELKYFTLGPSQRENRLRESLGIFITLHKARTVYLWRLEMKQKFYQILLLEILYVLKY